MIKKLFYFLFLILLISFVSASDDSNYEIIGGDLQDFNQGYGYFNEALDPFNVDFYSEAIGLSIYAPLVHDLDNDGIKEFITVSHGTGIIRIFQNISIDPIVSATYDLSEDYWISNPSIVDMDDDGLDEIFIVTDDRAHLLEYNGTSLSLVSVVPAGGRSNTATYCNDDTDLCIVMASGTGGHISLEVVNESSGVMNTTTFVVLATGAANKNYCLSAIPIIIEKDSDLDGDYEYYASFMQIGSGGNDLGIVYAEIDTNLGVVTGAGANSGIFYSRSQGFTTTASSILCHQAASDPGSMVAPLISFDFDLLHPGDEFLLAGLYDENEYKMYSIGYDGGFIDDYPELGQADGEVMGSIMKMDAFTDTGEVDACVIGYKPSDNTMSLLCASEQSDDFVEHKEFTYNTQNDDWDMSSTNAHINTLATAADMSRDTVETSNPDEIVTSFGVLSIYDALNSGTSNIINILQNTKGNSTVIPIDYNDDGRSELLIMTKNNLFLASDGFLNSDCSDQNCIFSYSIDPCLDGTWKINTTLDVTMEIRDVDDDVVSGRVILYEGDSNEMDSGWSGNYSSGTTISFNFDVNKTINFGNLKLMARAGDDITVTESINLPFSVGLDGLENGECVTTSYPGFTNITEAGEVGDTDIGNNSITNTLNWFTDRTGLGGAVLWLIIMIFIGVVILTSLHKTAASGDFFMMVGAVGVIEAFMIILGVYLGYFSATLVIIIGIIALAIIGLSFGRKVIGTGG